MFDIPFLDIPPLNEISGTVRLPGSKSISNRVLLLSALCQGTTVVNDLLDSDDTRVMLTTLSQLGCKICPQGQSVVIEGLGAHIQSLAQERAPMTLFMGNAGTAMRPLTAALAVLGGDFVLEGVARMHERPIGDLVDALRSMGCSIEYLEKEGYPPLRIGQPCWQLREAIQVRGAVSSQFLTALLMALPLVAQRQDIVIEVVGELISKPYIAITLNLLARFGVEVKREGWQQFTIPAGSRYVSPGQIYVEADASSASYFIAAGGLAARAEQPLRIEGVGANSIQGDIQFVQAAKQMGIQVTSEENALMVWRENWSQATGFLRPIDLDCNAIPDSAMTLAMLTLYGSGPSVLRNIGSWRVKETDRLKAMSTELRKLGANVEEGEDFIRITPPKVSDWRFASIHTYDDHRMAMCASLAAFNSACLPVRIQAPHCVAKTFPDYFEVFFAVVGGDSDRIPVICIDGPSASGKGTLGALVAKQLGYSHLDSGAIYRLVGYAATAAQVDLDDPAAVSDIARQITLDFQGQVVKLNGVDVSDEIRSEASGVAASKIASHSAVRRALKDIQMGFRKAPGLVADGRDMGTLIFPNALLKVFLTASSATRAERRYKQLAAKGISASIETLSADLEARDAADSTRAAAPLKSAQDALMLDNTDLSIEQSVAQVLEWWSSRFAPNQP